MTSLAAIAASVPEPMAMPRSAWVSAAASFTPSPTMATCPSPCWARRTTSTLSAGSTSAWTSSMSSCVAMARAARSLSPVSITVRIPSFLNSATARALLGLTVSATAIAPRA